MKIENNMMMQFSKIDNITIGEILVIFGQSLNRCWEKAMRLFIENSCSRNLCGREYYVLNDLGIQLFDYTLESELSDLCPWNLKCRNYYLQQVDTPGKKSEINRLYSFGSKKVNQYEFLIDSLHKRKNIKPIVIPICDPYKDMREHVPTPCISNLIIESKEGYVNMHVNYSTMNLFRMGLFDYHQMAYLHQKIIRDSGMKMGYLRIYTILTYMPIFDLIISKHIFGSKYE